MVFESPFFFPLRLPNISYYGLIALLNGCNLILPICGKCNKYPIDTIAHANKLYL